MNNVLASSPLRPLPKEPSNTIRRSPTLTRPANGRAQPAEAAPAPVQLKTAALGGSVPEIRAGLRRGSGARCPALLPLPIFPPAGRFYGRASCFPSEIGDISGGFPGHVRHPHTPL